MSRNDELKSLVTDVMAGKDIPGQGWFEFMYAHGKVLIEDVADAKRYRWLCNGNGYFMEENYLCGHYNEKRKADVAIDKEMGITSTTTVPPNLDQVALDAAYRIADIRVANETQRMAMIQTFIAEAIVAYVAETDGD